MKHILPSLAALSVFISCPSLEGTESSIATPSTSTKQNVSTNNFVPFTGKITKNKVRLRLQPSYDSQVLRELNRNDLVVILDENDDFYGIKPSPDFRAYVYRTLVLDNVVEGNRVNVRLKPDLDAPVIAQLNTGDRVNGAINAGNTKWLDINLPDTVRFYIAKDYVEKIGDASLKERLDKKREEAFQLLNTTEAVSKAELQKPFERMNIDAMKANYQHIIYDFPEIPEAGAKAKELLTTLQEAYMAKKLTYLEEQSKSSASTVQTNKKLAEELSAHKSKIAQLEQQIDIQNHVPIAARPSLPPGPPPLNMSIWIPIEECYYRSWTEKTGRSPKDYYEEQQRQAFTLTGIIDPYTRTVNNKPGDFMLISSNGKLPVAFLYSTHVNLQDYVGREVRILVSERRNNNFAFPAYFVLAIE